MGAALGARRHSLYEARSSAVFYRTILCGTSWLLDGMVIGGSGPSLAAELRGPQNHIGFPDPDLFDHLAHSRGPFGDGGWRMGALSTVPRAEVAFSKALLAVGIFGTG